MRNRKLVYRLWCVYRSNVPPFRWCLTPAADAHPDAEVTGVDLSPIQPSLYVPFASMRALHAMALACSDQRGAAFLPTASSRSMTSKKSGVEGEIRPHFRQEHYFQYIQLGGVLRKDLQVCGLPILAPAKHDTNGKSIASRREATSKSMITASPSAATTA